MIYRNPTITVCERRARPRLFSSGGIRADAVLVLSALVVVVLLCVLFSDLAGIRASGENIRRMSLAVERLESENNSLYEEYSVRNRYSVSLAPVSSSAPASDGSEQVIRISVP